MDASHILGQVDDLQGLFEALVDLFPDLVFCIKDREGRYVSVSQSFLGRVHRKDKKSLLGKTAEELFPAVMARRYRMQDEMVLQTGKPVTHNLDITVYADGSFGWCHTNKLPIRNRENEIIGLACISKDIASHAEHDWVDKHFAEAIDYILTHTDHSFPLKVVADIAHLSVAQFDRRVKKIYGVTTGQFILKARLDEAAHRILTTDTSLAVIATECGFCDQSALTRRFKTSIGCTPSQYRQLFKR